MSNKQYIMNMLNVCMVYNKYMDVSLAHSVQIKHVNLLFFINDFEHAFNCCVATWIDYLLIETIENNGKYKNWYTFPVGNYITNNITN